MDSLPKDLDQGLLQELECPVCMEYMTSPITMCENGHSICSNCKPKLNNCPSCKKSFLNIRNLALESLSRQVTDQGAQNQPARVPQSVECPFTRISKDTCPWKGSVMDMKQHVKVFHNNVNDTHESNEVFNVILTGLSPTQHYRKAVFISDELFYVYWRIEGGTFYCAVFYVGEEGKSSQYKYRFTLTSQSDDRKVSMTFPTRCILENVDEVLQSGDSVILSYSTVSKFFNSKIYLECEFQINSIEIHGDIASGTRQQNPRGASDVHSSLFSRSRRYHRIWRHEKEHNPGSPEELMSVIRLRRCVHGRRFRHCASCKYIPSLSDTQGAASTSGTESLQSIHSPTGFYCAPSGYFAENASAEKYHADAKVLPSAPVENPLHTDTVGNFSSNLSSARKLYDEKYGYSGRSLSEENSCSMSNDYVPSCTSSDSTWKCSVCEQIAPTSPDLFPEPGWHVATSSTDKKWKCKMCGQIRK
jgi:E3 ubiquitin-protein ligase SIAH1